MLDLATSNKYNRPFSTSYLSPFPPYMLLSKLYTFLLSLLVALLIPILLPKYRLEN